jgi:hypothetical protein
MRTESDHPIGFHPLPSPQNLLHHARHVVVAQRAEHSAEVGEGVFVRFQQRLLRGPPVGAVVGVAGCHAAHREKLQLAEFAAQLHHRLEPVDLRFLAQFVALWHARHAAVQPKLLFAPLHIAAHRRFGDWVLRLLLHQPRPDAMRSVPLFPRRLPVGFQHDVDRRFQQL